MITFTAEQRHKKTKLITVIGAIANIFLALTKCIAGWLGNSHALFADGIHSLSDLFADAAVLVASKFGNQAADSEHPYGHHRIETAGTIIVAAFLLSAAIAIIFEGVQHIIAPHPSKIHPYVLGTAILALVINEIIYHVTLSVAKKISSNMLRAHAWHRRSDAAASLIVLIGIVGSMLGLTYLDGISALIIGLFILKMAYQMGHESFEELIDRGLNHQKLAEIRRVIQAQPGVEALHQLRTRLMAGQIFADVHIIVQPYLSVSEGHYIGDHVFTRLKEKFPEINDITIHVDSENDEQQHDADALPDRAIITQQLANIQAKLIDYSEMNIKTIHYIGNKLILELVFPLSCLQHQKKEDLHENYQKTLQQLFPQMNVVIYFH